MSDVEFWVNIIKPDGAATADQLKFVVANCTPVVKRGVYFFEGDWESFKDDELSAYENLGECIVPPLGGLSDDQLAAIYDDWVEDAT